MDLRFKIKLSDETEQEVNPLWSNNARFDYTREGEFYFFRRVFTEKLTFVRSDFDLIINQPFEHIFTIYIDTRENELTEWKVNDWVGTFSIIDCDIDEDNRIIEVQPEAADQYKEILEGLEKEFDLIKLAPRTRRVEINANPILQVYIPGSTVVTSLSGVTYYETNISPIFDETELKETYFFKEGKRMFFVSGEYDVSGEYTNELKHIPSNFRYEIRETANSQIMFRMFNITMTDDDFLSIWQSENGEQYRYLGNLANDYYFEIITGSGNPTGSILTHVSGAVNTQDHQFASFQQITTYKRKGIFDTDTNEFIYLANYDAQNSYVAWNYQGVIFHERNGTNKVRVFEVPFYCRILTNNPAPPIAGIQIEPIPEEDILTDSQGFQYVAGVNHFGFIGSGLGSDDPTRWGRFDVQAANNAERYFLQPTDPALNNLLPVARSEWMDISIWIYENNLLDLIKEATKETYILRDAYLISDAIEAILQQIAPDIQHFALDDYSQFLYTSNITIRDGIKVPLITPKSNILAGNYDQPATKAKIKLSDIFNLLKDFYNCSWFIDEQKRLRIEHIEFFENGNSYMGSNIGLDLTAEQYEPKNNLPWEYRTRRYKYSKPDIVERINWGWMDEVSEPFEGQPIELISTYVDKGNFQEKNISLFTSDIDYMLANKNDISKDGFFFMEATPKEPNLSDIDTFYNSTLALPLPAIETAPGVFLKMQNGFCSMAYAVRYWLYQMPARRIIVNEVETTAESVKKLRVQEITIAKMADFDIYALIKTGLGAGKIDKIEQNIPSGELKITLHHETERN